MRILLATPFLRTARGEVLGSYAQGLEEGLGSIGHRVIVVSTWGVERALPPVLRHVMYGFRVLVRALRADAVIALDVWSTGFPTLIAARLLRKRFVVRIGGDFLWESFVERAKVPVLLSDFYRKPRPFTLKEKLIRRGIRYLVHHADALLFTTRFQRDIWQEVYAFPSEKARIVENYFPRVGRMTPAKERVFVSAGRNMFLKNMDTLRRAYKNIASRYTDVSLDTRSLERQAHLDRLSHAYAVVIPTFSEVCSNLAIEAVSYGKPFIMSQDTGTSERLAACGLFVDTRSEEDLTRAMERILEPSTYEKLQEGIRAFSHIHSWEDIAREVAASLSRV